MAAKRRGVYRPANLTPEVMDSVKKALQLGSFRKTAALWAGISYTSFREWMAFGKERPRSEYGKFRRMVIKTETEAEIRVGGVLLKAATESPKYARDWLELRYRKRWNPTHKLELTGKGGTALIPPVDPMSLLEKLKKMELSGPGMSTAAAAAYGIRTRDDLEQSAMVETLVLEHSTKGR